MALPPNLATDDVIDEVWTDAVVSELTALPGRYASVNIGLKSQALDTSAPGAATVTGTPVKLATGSNWTAIAGRLYVIETILTYQGSVAGDVFTIDHYVDAAFVATIATFRYTTPVAFHQNSLMFRTNPFTIAAGVRAPSLYATRASGTGQLTTGPTLPRLVNVYDVG